MSSKDYWATRTWDSPGHPIKEYASVNDAYEHVLFDDLLLLLPKASSFFELGCNAGKHLHWLDTQGYGPFGGIDINVEACTKHFRDLFPATAAKAQVWPGDAIRQITKVPTDGFDVVYTIGTLMNIPEKAILKEVCRVAKKYIMVKENSRYEKHAYRAVFEAHGFMQIMHKTICKKTWGNFYTHEPQYISDLRLFVKADESLPDSD